jgi:hypothetical protein
MWVCLAGQASDIIVRIIASSSLPTAGHALRLLASRLRDPSITRRNRGARNGETGRAAAGRVELKNFVLKLESLVSRPDSLHDSDSEAESSQGVHSLQQAEVAPTLRM